MDTCINCAEDYPADISFEEGVQARAFLKDIEVVIEDSFELFVGLSEK